MGAWIEIILLEQLGGEDKCRTPRWVRGLKYARSAMTMAHITSHPTMGAWIEIKAVNKLILKIDKGRTPRWVRGLKSILCIGWKIAVVSHPTMGAWIEIIFFLSILNTSFVAPHDGCVDWNQSTCFPLEKNVNVAPHDGCVDWNFLMPSLLSSLFKVAPHDGCVDWNPVCVSCLSWHFASHPTMGAWIEIFNLYTFNNATLVAPHDGCVDWNPVFIDCHNIHHLSHPTMGAWIEIEVKRYIWYKGKGRTPRWVRGLKSCSHSQKNPGPRRTPRWVRGLKSWCTSPADHTPWSHPTMGAWIEIQHCIKRCNRDVVAPHDGCVDWNCLSLWMKQYPPCRTPRWVRGLKYLVGVYSRMYFKSHPTMGAWIEIDNPQTLMCGTPRRTPRWVRGLKFKQRIKKTRH